MASNFIKPGKHLTFTAGANVASGGGVVLGSLIGVALTAVANGASGEAAVEGVWEMPKAAGAAINAWSKPVWKVGAANFAASGAVTGDILNAVVAVETAASAATKVKVKLLPGSGSVSP